MFVRSRIDSHGDYRRIVATANFHYQSNRCRRDDVEMWRRKKQRQHLFNEKLYQWHEDIIHYAILYMYLGPSKHVFGTKFWNDRNILVFGTTDQHGTSRVFGPKISGILDRLIVVMPVITQLHHRRSSLDCITVTWLHRLRSSLHRPSTPSLVTATRNFETMW